MTMCVAGLSAQKHPREHPHNINTSKLFQCGCVDVLARPGKRSHWLASSKTRLQML